MHVYEAKNTISRIMAIITKKGTSEMGCLLLTARWPLLQRLDENSIKIAHLLITYKKCNYARGIQCLRQ